MSTSHPRPHRVWAQQTIALLVATCMTLLAISADAAARTTHPTATISSAALHRAIAVRTTDRRALARYSSKLNACLLAQTSRCSSDRHTIKRSRVRLAAAERRVRSLSARISRRHHASKGTRTPPSTLGGSGSSTDSHSTQGTGSGSIQGAGSGSGGSTESPGSGSTSSGTFEMGVVAGSALTFERPFIQKLGARTARMEFEINTPTSRMAPAIEAYALAGIKPLLLASFHGTLPTTSEAQNLASWAAAFGPGGTLWQGRSFPAGTAVTDIEFGNETSYAYQYSDTSETSDWYTLSSYAARAQTYALRLKDAQVAVQATNSKVGLLAQADDGDSGSSAWVDNMFAAVPDLAGRVAGWTVHPYGPSWQTKIDKLVSSTSAHGASTAIPIYVTEWGLASDNGRCLSDNYGWNTCMTFSEASTTLDSTVSAMKARYGVRLAAFYLYQAHDQAATGASTSRESYFGALQSNGAPKGAYTITVQSLLAANP